jgi:hypothetical protein
MRDLLKEWLIWRIGDGVIFALQSLRKILEEGIWLMLE